MASGRHDRRRGVPHGVVGPALAGPHFPLRPGAARPRAWPLHRPAWSPALVVDAADHLSPAALAEMVAQAVAQRTKLVLVLGGTVPFAGRSLAASLDQLAGELAGPEMEELMPSRAARPTVSVPGIPVHGSLTGAAAMAHIVDAWAAATPAGKRPPLMVAFGPAEAEALNATARARRPPRPEVLLGGRRYAVGDEVIALRRLGSVSGATRGTVVALEDQALHVAWRGRAGPLTAPVGAEHADALGHGYATTIPYLRACQPTEDSVMVLGDPVALAGRGAPVTAAWVTLSGPGVPAPGAAGMELRRRAGVAQLATGWPDAQMLERAGPRPPDGPSRRRWAEIITASAVQRQEGMVAPVLRPPRSGPAPEVSARALGAEKRGGRTVPRCWAPVRGPQAWPPGRQGLFSGASQARRCPDGMADEEGPGPPLAAVPGRGRLRPPGYRRLGADRQVERAVRGGGLLNQLRWEWLVLAGAAEAGSYVALAFLERTFLRAGDVRAHVGRLTTITFAGASIQSALPVGAAFGGVYDFRQFQLIGADEVLAGWVVIAVGAVSFATLAVLAGIGLAMAASLGSTFDLVEAILGVLLVAVLAAAAWANRSGVYRLALHAAGRLEKLLRRPSGQLRHPLYIGLERMRSVAPTRREWGSAVLAGPLAGWRTVAAWLAPSSPWAPAFPGPACCWPTAGASWPSTCPSPRAGWAWLRAA